MTTASVWTSAYGVFCGALTVASIVVLLAFLWLGLVLIAEDLEHTYRTNERVRLAGHDDESIDFTAALRPGPLPPFGQEQLPPDPPLLAAGAIHATSERLRSSRSRNTSGEQGGSDQRTHPRTGAHR